jgi:hypothetical protein
MWKRNLHKIAVSSLAATVWFGGYNTVLAIDWDDANNTSADNNWSNTGNWNPDGSPTGLAVNIGNLATAANDTTIVDTFFSITSLTLSNGADVDTSTNALLVNGATIVGGAGSSLLLRQTLVPSDESLDTNTLTINSGGTASMFTGSSLQVDNGLLEINAGGVLSGNGVIELEDNPVAVTQLLENSGTLTATSDGGFGDLFGSNAATLTINAINANARIDLDGDTEAGVVNVNRNDTLDINVTLDDPFGGTMNLAEGSTLDISTAWSLSAGDININTNAILIGTPGAAATITGGAFTLASGNLNLDDIDRVNFTTPVTTTGGAINNAGGITFSDTATIGAGTNFSMTGTSAALTVGAGKLVSINDADFNLDGAGTTTNFTTIGDGGELDINLNDAFADDDYGHTVVLNGGILDVVNLGTATVWSMSGGDLTVNDGVAVSQLQGDGLSISNQNVVLNANAQLNINTAEVLLGNSTNVTIAEGAQLDLGTNARFTGVGSSYTGAGTLVAANTTTVDAATTLNVAIVDLDAGDWTFNAATVINANNLETGGTNDVGNNQVFTIANTGSLTINLPNATDFWRLDTNGDMIYNGDAAIGTFLQGNDIEIDGDFDINGQGRTTARLVNISSQVDIAAAGRLQLGGGNLTDVNTIAGGTINGPGTLGADNGHSLHGFGTINAPIDFSGSADLRADNGELVVTGAILDARNVGTGDTDGILNVVPAWNSAGIGTVSLQGGELKGGTVTLDNALGLSGRGLVSSRVFNNSRVQASAGNLKVQTAANNNDWDGAGNTGSLQAANGTLELHDNANFSFGGGGGGSASVISGTMSTNGFGFNFQAGSTVALDSGTYKSDAATNFSGAVNVAAGGGTMSIGPFATFASGSSTTLTGNLVLDNAETRIASGATFAGGGVLKNAVGKLLNLQDGANVGVAIQNDGVLFSTGESQVQGLDYVQTATGRANFSLAGTNPVSDFDRLTLSGLAQLAGQLTVSLPGGYTPALGDTYQILSATGGVSGAFTNYSIQVFDLTRSLAVKYNATNVTLQVIAGFWGDYNGNGEVDAADYTIYRDSLGQAVPAFTGADGSGNGIIDAADYNVWVANFGKINALSSVAAIAASSSAVPEPSSVLLVIGGVALLTAARRR